ncbi:MAG: YIP1 family protein [Candidatus Kryptoniota bacterium]
MDQSDTTANLPEQPGNPPETRSFVDNAAGIFYEPSRVFEYFKTAGIRVSDWLIPVLVFALLGALSAYIRMSSPELRSQIIQQQEEAIDKMVNEGKMTRDQADQTKTIIEDRFSTGSVIGISSVTAFVFIFIMFFILSGIWYLVGRFGLKSAITYSQAMGITGITNWILIVGSIVGTAITVALARLDGGLHLGMLSKISTTDKLYLAMAKVDVFTIWSLIIVSIGLARFSSRKTTDAAIWVFGLWILWGILSIFVLGGRFG